MPRSRLGPVVVVLGALALTGTVEGLVGCGGRSGSSAPTTSSATVSVAAGPGSSEVSGRAAVPPPAPNAPSAGPSAASAASASVAPPAGWAVAVTIDDLPWIGKTRPGESHAAATDRLLGALRRHGVVATGFVNCAHLGTEALAERWLAAGMTLGNHTALHHDLDEVGLERWLRDVAACEAPLVALTGSHPPFFRYPYLHEGATPGLRNAAAAGLAAMRYRVAQVTINSHDWIFAAAYGRALAGERGDAGAIGRDYLAHVRAAATQARARGRAVTGREIAHVMLFHANALEADHLDAVLTALSADGARFVSLEEAESDPVYALPDAYAGRESRTWLDRVAPVPSEPWDIALERSLVQAMP